MKKLIYEFKYNALALIADIAAIALLLGIVFISGYFIILAIN